VRGTLVHYERTVRGEDAASVCGAGRGMAACHARVTVWTVRVCSQVGLRVRVGTVSTLTLTTVCVLPGEEEDITYRCT